MAHKYSDLKRWVNSQTNVDDLPIIFRLGTVDMDMKSMTVHFDEDEKPVEVTIELGPPDPPAPFDLPEAGSGER